MSLCKNKEYVNVLLDNGYTKSEIRDMSTKEIKDLALDIMDTSDMHPNESCDEFVEHENFE